MNLIEYLHAGGKLFNFCIKINPFSIHLSRPPSQEDPSRRNARIISQFEEQHGLKIGDIGVFAPKLRLRISSVNVNWINLPSIPNFPNKVHQS
jgi:hypothetical protein